MSRTATGVSPAEGRHICGLLALELAGDPPVTTGGLAERLGVSGATVTETLQRVDKSGLVSYEPYVGAELTDRGERVARRLLWRGCVVQQFFETTADVSLDATAAYRIGRVLPSDDLARLNDRLSRPCEERCEATDPDDCRLLGER